MKSAPSIERLLEPLGPDGASRACVVMVSGADSGPFIGTFEIFNLDGVGPIVPLSLVVAGPKAFEDEELSDKSSGGGRVVVTLVLVARSGLRCDPSLTMLPPFMFNGCPSSKQPSWLPNCLRPARLLSLSASSKELAMVRTDCRCDFLEPLEDELLSISTR